MMRRIVIVIAVLVSTAVAVRGLSRPEPALDRAPLDQLTRTLDDWRALDQPLDPKVIRTLGVDDYVNRMYQAAADAAPVFLYVGFYATQRTGETIHSPMQCLPGNGWQPISTGIREVPVDTSAGERRIRINHYVVQQGAERHVVLFWYHMRGHVVASEYTAKLYLIDGALRTNRTDGALVRVIVPVDEATGVAAADAEAAKFVRRLFPLLDHHLPS